MNSVELFRIGLALLKQGEFRQASELATSAVIDFPDDGNLWELRGVSEHHLGNHSAGQSALETASLLQPLDVGARYCLAGCYAATGSRELAVFLFQMVAEDPRAPLWLLTNISSRLGQMNEHEAALGVCRLILLRDDNRPEAHFGVAFYLRRLGAPVEVVAESAARAQELAPDVPLYRVVLASLLQELGQIEDAYDLLRQLAPESVGCPCSLRRMMRVFDAVSDHERIKACAQRVAELKKNSSQEEENG
jgi:tetratricopeptide (TPR) repeat protein